MSRFRVLLGAVVAALALSLVGAGPAAAQEPAKLDRVAEIFAPCIKLAAESKAPAWTCTAAGLTVTRRDANGKATQSLTPVAPLTSGTGSASALADDYDSWCEDQAVCHRNPFGDKFLEETKGNAAYGNGPTLIGSFDIVIRTNLNGRQAQWRETFIWDSGPGVSFARSPRTAGKPSTSDPI